LDLSPARRFRHPTGGLDLEDDLLGLVVLEIPDQYVTLAAEGLGRKKFVLLDDNCGNPGAGSGQGTHQGLVKSSIQR
jgi:hypothetical protein